MTHSRLLLVQPNKDLSKRIALCMNIEPEKTKQNQKSTARIWKKYIYIINDLIKTQKKKKMQRNIPDRRRPEERKHRVQLTNEKWEQWSFLMLDSWITEASRSQQKEELFFFLYFFFFFFSPKFAELLNCKLD